jgi:hypothetical protein
MFAGKDRSLLMREQQRTLRKTLGSGVKGLQEQALKLICQERQ